MGTLPLDTTEVVVVVGGAALLALLVWFFFGARAAASARRETGAASQEIEITVQGGYAPDVVTLAAGLPSRLVFHRTETSTCSEEVVIPDARVRRFLPAHEKTVVELPPLPVGRYPFTCGMGMLRGTLVVQ